MESGDTLMNGRGQSRNVMRMIGIAVTLVVVLQGCDGNGAQPDPDPTDSLRVDLEAFSEARVAGDHLELIVSESGSIARGFWSYHRGDGGDNWVLRFLNGAGVVIVTERDDIRASTSFSWGRDIGINKFVLSSQSGTEAGIFVLDESLDDYEITNWPIELGAPVNSDGSHKRYGDHMAWLSIEAASPTTAPGLEALNGLRVGVSVFVSEEPGFQNVVFMRYDVQNISGTAIPSVQVGYFSDTDLNHRDTPGIRCTVNSGLNQSGYDLSRDFVYAYLKPNSSDGDLDPECYAISAGFGFLDLTSGNASQGTEASRIVTKSPFATYYPNFSDALIDDPQKLSLALRGLDADGNPMIDPSTAMPTAFAFSGDPIEGSGWLDERNDLRHLISKPEFSLGPDETKSVVVAWVLAEGESYVEAIENVRSTFASVKQARSIWDY